MTTPTHPIVPYGEVKVGQQYRRGPGWAWTIKDRPSWTEGAWVEMRPERYVAKRDSLHSDFYKVHDLEGPNSPGVAYFKVSKLGEAKANELATNLAESLNEEQS